MYVPDRYRNQKMCNKVVTSYAHALEFVHNFYKTQQM